MSASAHPGPWHTPCSWEKLCCFVVDIMLEYQQYTITTGTALTTTVADTTHQRIDVLETWHKSTTDVCSMYRYVNTQRNHNTHKINATRYPLLKNKFSLMLCIIKDDWVVSFSRRLTSYLLIKLFEITLKNINRSTSLRHGRTMRF